MHALRTLRRHLAIAATHPAATLALAFAAGLACVAVCVVVAVA